MSQENPATSENPATPYEKIGGEAGVEKLVNRFYDLMDSLPEAREVRAIHAKSLKGSRRKLILFLSGWLGGPDLYVEKYGHPRLRQRHFPFAIGVQERDQWLMCMDQSLLENVTDERLRQELSVAFARLGDHMRNQAEVA
ncbi:group II truncated hemoglobin [Thermithiobacillus plumbiphilus]|uniref:Group II truncated hemoglobin n=1 Tax=Thermithiobacillus plumbiphilus TaxID=1729899 RepID=A0ABU9D724_9PROT